MSTITGGLRPGIRVGSPAYLGTSSLAAYENKWLLACAGHNLRKLRRHHPES